MLRTIGLASLLILATACFDDAALEPDPGDPELATAVSPLGDPDPNPSHTQIASLNGSPGGCLDLPLGVPAGQPLWLQQFPCNAGDNQRFRFVPVAPDVYRIHSSRNTGLCLDLPSSNAVSGQDVQLYPCHSGNNQLWLVDSSGSSAVIKSILHLGLCLDVEDGTVNAPARVQLFTCHGGANQAWRFRTWLGTDGSVRGCNGNVRFGAGGPIVSPGGVNSFAVTGGNVETLCSDSLPFPRDTVGCPSTTNWMVPDRRNGTGNYPVACFRQ
jgi:hypothetical protein